MKPSDQYIKIVEWSEQDQCYVGSCPGLMLGVIQGDDETRVYAQLCKAVDEWIQVYENEKSPLPPATAGKTYSGRVLIRVGKELHKALATDAIRHGQSLNAFCISLLRRERVQYGTYKTRPSAKRRESTPETTR
jgi:predicted HicB family RNase H-like nuclease